jgi:cytochrome c556
MNRFPARASVVVGSLAAVLLGYAASQAQTAHVGSGDLVADRQRLMKLQGANLQDLNAKLKAGNIDGIAVNADTIALTAQHIPSLFPQGSMTDKSNAKPEIWQKFSEFEAAAKNLQAKAEALRDAARSKDAQATEAAAKDFFRLNCNSCHTPFRVPPKS